jgi:hypothetical protein
MSLLGRARAEADALSTSPLNLGRRTPRNARQREQALAGIAQCDADWAAGTLTTSDDMISQHRDAYWRAGYQVRWSEHAATLPRSMASFLDSSQDIA